jgi:hypothetical protein
MTQPVWLDTGRPFLRCVSRPESHQTETLS